MQWDLGLQGVAVLGAISLGFGMFAGLVAGRGTTRRLVATAITTVACFGAGLLTSEGIFGWATEEDLQPNIDGLSRDEALLSSVLTTVLVLVVMRLVARREGAQRSHRDWIGHQQGRHRHA